MNLTSNAIQRKIEKAFKLLQKITFAVFLISCNRFVTMKPPVAQKIPKELVACNHTRIDNYYWLNDRENPKVIEYLEKENSYTDNCMNDYADLKDKLFNEMVGRIKQDDASVPYKKNGYYYYTRYEKDQEYPIYCRKKETLDNAEEILLNENILAEGKEYCNVGSISISPDNKLMAYGIDTFSRRMYSIVIQDIASGKELERTLPISNGAAVWATDCKTLFYTFKDEQTLRAYRIYKHRLGSKFEDDALVFEEKDDMFNTSVFKSKSGKYIYIASYSKTSDEYRFVDADQPDGMFKIIQPREKDLEYSVEYYDSSFYIHTNLDAKNFRLMVAPVSAPSKENWKEIIPHRSDVLLEDVEILKSHLILSERKNGLVNIRLIDWTTKKDTYIDFGEEAYSAGLGQNPEFDSPFLRYNFSSLTTPASVFDYNLLTGEKSLKKQQEVIGDFNSKNYESRRLYAIARDGQKVPVSLVYKKGIVKNGKNPLLLYGYGSYGISIDAYFSAARLSLLDRGFIFAIAHIRGGQELGRDWYESGKMLNKQNTFNDFIDCAEYLVQEKYTNSEHLFAMGGSAGGLLVGAVANTRPELFAGLIAAVPFVDVLTTMLDESIPLTTGEYIEWGNPNDSVYYNYMLSYSPYDNVKHVAYPSMLVTTGLHDSQVQYWEPAKWVAKLRDMKTDNNLLLLKTNMSTGHGGASGRFQAYHDNALQYAFLLKLIHYTE